MKEFRICENTRVRKQRKLRWWKNLGESSKGEEKYHKNCQKYTEIRPKFKWARMTFSNDYSYKRTCKYFYFDEQLSSLQPCMRADTNLLSNPFIITE